MIALALVVGVKARGAAKLLELKFEFAGKLVSKQRVHVGRGAAFGKVFRDKLKFEITESRKGGLKRGIVVPCELARRLNHTSPVTVLAGSTLTGLRVRERTCCALAVVPRQGVKRVTDTVHTVEVRPPAITVEPVPADKCARLLGCFETGSQGRTRRLAS